MKKETQKKLLSKPLKIVYTLFAVILVGLLAAYLAIHFYLSKINYQTSGGNTSYLSEQDLLEEDDLSGPNSPEEQIAALEARLKAQIDAAGEVMFDKDVINILVIGCDSREKGGQGRSDTIILLSINKNTKEITMTSFMRDSYVVIPGYTNNRINAAYAYGGAQLLMDTLKTNFAVDVDKYVMIDFYSFVDIVDCIGGIDVEVSDAEVEVMNDYIHELNQLNHRAEDTYKLTGGGNLHLNGTQALAYARVRYVGNADFERTQRQRTVIERVFEQARQMNLLEINDLLNLLLPEVTTNMTEGEILSLLLNTSSYLQYDLQQLRIPVDHSYEYLRIRGMSVLGVDLKKNIDALYAQIYKN